LADADRDALAAMRAHLDDAHAAADRLVREAQRQAEEADPGAAADVPPRGWDAPTTAGRPGVPDLQALLALVDGVRRSIPPELSRQLAEAVRELLLAVRALIDWYLERLGAPGAGRSEVEVEDIPLD
jgi:hypothetical protein